MMTAVSKRRGPFHFRTVRHIVSGKLVETAELLELKAGSFEWNKRILIQIFS